MKLINSNLHYLPVIGTLIFTWTTTSVQAQCSGWNDLQSTDSVFTNPAFGNATTPEIDRLQRPYTYLATVEGGVKIYDNNASGNPILVASVPTDSLGSLDAINLVQDSTWLYVSLGNIWNTNQMAGLAIINVSNPAAPIVSDVYVHPGAGGGAGSCAVQGDYAYLAANQNGLVILDISDKGNIQFKSALPLSNDFPHTNTGNSSLYNARGIDVKGQFAYICYDRGGLRIVDVSDVNAPVQINQYCYPPLVDKITAYNNIIVHNNLAYVAIDYYGMEILEVSDPYTIIHLGWWHPETWADTTNNFNTWANSKGHANEIAYDSICKKVYVAAGKTDIAVIDVNNPSSPFTCQIYGSDTDDYGTWGLDFFDDTISIAYIWSVAAPPYSNYTGFKTFQKYCNTAGLTENNYPSSGIFVYPNPASDVVRVNVSQQVRSVRILDVTGTLIAQHSTTEFSVENLPDGLYFLLVQTDESVYSQRLVKR